MRRDSSAIERARQVDGETRRVVDGEGYGLRRRAIQHELDLELVAWLRLQLDLGEPGGRLRKRDLRGECECPGQRDERRGAEGPMQAASLRAAMVHVRRCSGHSRISLQIIRSAQVRRGAR